MGAARMRAAAISAPRQVEIREVAIPDPAPGEVRFRVEGCGLCGSNLGPWKGLPGIRYPRAAGEGGHEAWGVVDAVGEGVSQVRVGDRVCALSNNAWAEFDRAPADQLVPLTPALAGRPFPGEPVACAINAFRRSRIGPGQVVAVIGIGFLGALLTRFAAAAGARVIAVSRRPYALEVARGLGASQTFALEQPGLALQSIREQTAGRLCDRVIEVTGHQCSLELAGELVRERGVLVIAGYHQDGTRQVNLQLWNWRGIDVVNAHERDPRIYVEGMRSAVEMAGAGAIDPSSLCTHRFPLERIAEAFETLEERPPGFLKAVVAP